MTPKALQHETQKQENSHNPKNSSQHHDDDDSIEIGACCLCHCALDYSDRAAFFRVDREEDYDSDSDDSEEYFFRPNDPYLPISIYDSNNALVYCDSCDRMYHQKCHFVPISVLPRGKWECLLCQSFKGKSTTTTTTTNSSGSRKKSSNKSNSSSSNSVTNLSLSRTWSRSEQRQMFQSPSVVAAKALEDEWEFDSRHYKAAAWKRELSRTLKQSVITQGTNYRLAETAALTLTTTARNRRHFASTGLASQELAQTLCKLYGARKQWRSICQNLEDLRLATNERLQQVLNFAQHHCTEEFRERVLFPFGMDHPQRIVPRTPEMKLKTTEKQTQQIPEEIIISSSTGRCKKATTKSSPPRRQKQHAKITADNNKDDDSGISLDDLKCCVCFTSEATDENDLLMCDGAGCYRAYHMQCIHPRVKIEDIENEDEDWFCPLCLALSDIMLQIQTEHMGDDWEQSRYALQWAGKDMTDSLKSWDRVDEVFPTAEQDYAAACQMKQGKRNKATDDLLARVLGLDQLPDHDDDDEDEDGHFDLDSFRENRQKEREDDADGDSTHSSQATLVEMSSVELEIKKGELDALSRGSASGSDDESDSDESDDVRRSRRLRKLDSRGNTRSSDTSDSDPGKFDKANIIEGKRGRKPVDYIKLNEAIFGDAEGSEAENLDDTDDFEAKRARKSDVSSDDDSEDSSSGSSSDEGGSESDSDSKSESAEDAEGGRSGEENKEDEEVTLNGKKRKTASRTSKSGPASKKQKVDVKDTNARPKQSEPVSLSNELTNGNKKSGRQKMTNPKEAWRKAQKSDKASNQKAAHRQTKNTKPASKGNDKTGATKSKSRFAKTAVAVGC